MATFSLIYFRLKQYQKFLFLTALLLFTSVNSSRSEEIRLYYKSGNVKVSFPDGTENYLQINQTICSACAIIINRDTEIIVRDDKNRFCTLKGTDGVLVYTYNSLIELIEKQQDTGILNAALGFLSEQITDKKKDIREYSELHLKQHGGIARGCVYPIMLRPGNGERVISDSLLFVWSSEQNVSEYQLNIYAGDESEIKPRLVHSAQVNDTIQKVRLSDLASTNENVAKYHWVVYPINSKPNCARYSFEIYSSEMIERLLIDTENNFEPNISDEHNLLIKAAQFESLGLFQHAIETYLQLLSEYDNSVYSDLYLLFLARNGMI